MRFKSNPRTLAFQTRALLSSLESHRDAFGGALIRPQGPIPVSLLSDLWLFVVICTSELALCRRLYCCNVRIDDAHNISLRSSICISHLAKRLCKSLSIMSRTSGVANRVTLFIACKS
jgi:hypothetical protein